MNSLAHIGHVVSDIDVSVRFFTELFGFTTDRELSFEPEHLQDLLQLDPPSNMRAVYLLLGGFTLELMQFNPESRETAGSRVFNQTGLTHISLVVDDPAEIMGRVADFGGTIVSNIGIAFVIRDPDGQLIELLPPSYNDGIEEQRRAQHSKG